MSPLLLSVALAGPVDDAWTRLIELEASGYPDIAAAEVVAALIEHPNDPAAPLIRFQLAEFQGRWSHQTGEVRTLVLGAEAHPELAAWYALARAGVHLRREEWNALEVAAIEARPASPAANTFEAWAHLGRGEPAGARSLITDPHFLAALDDWDQTPHRKPMLAAGLTAVLPGLGQGYAGRPGSGLGSLVVEAGLAAGAYALLRDDNLAAGVAVGTLLVSSHLALIGDAARQARLFNERAETRRLADIKREFAPVLVLTDDPTAPLRVVPPSGGGAP